MPTVELAKSLFENGLLVTDLLFETKLCASKSDARRLIEGGGAAVNNKTVADVKTTITLADADGDGEYVVRAGKKKFARVVVK